MKQSTAGILFLVLALGMVGYVIQTTVGTVQMEHFKDHRNGSQRCGVGLPGCRPLREGDSVRCINGWCRSDRIH